MQAASSRSCRWNSSTTITRRRPGRSISPRSTSRSRNRRMARIRGADWNPVRRSLRARLVASFLIVSAVTVLVVGALTYARATDELTSSLYDRLDAVAGIKADALDRWIEEQTRNVVFVTRLPGVGDEARDLLDPATPRATGADADASLRSLLA